MTISAVLSSRRVVLAVIAVTALIVPAGGFAVFMIGDRSGAANTTFGVGQDAARQTVAFHLPKGWNRATEITEPLIAAGSVSFLPRDQPSSEPREAVAFRFQDATPARLPKLFAERLTQMRGSCKRHADKPVRSELPNLVTGTFMVLFRCRSRPLAVLMIFKEADGGMLIAERYEIDRDAASEVLPDTRLRDWLTWANSITISSGG